MLGMYYVYVLRGPKQFYIGSTGDLRRRLVEGGLFRVGQMEWRHRGNDCYPHVVISYVGSLDPTKLLYEVRFA